MFWYEEVIQVSALRPLFVPFTGGTRITLLGSGFSRRGHIRCRFGEDNQWTASPISYAYVISAGEMVCTAPSQGDFLEDSRTVQVFLATGGEDFKPSGFWVTYVQQMVIDYFNTARVDEAGGRSITIVGRHFPDVPDLACRFAGGELIPALWLRSTAVRCLTPSLPQGDAVIEMTFNAAEFVSAPQMLAIQASVTVTGIDPASGPMNGGTKVTVTGTGFGVADAIKGGFDRFDCLFGTSRAAANVSSPGRLTCEAPVGFGNTAMDKNGFVPVRVIRRMDRGRIEETSTSPSSTPFLYTKEAVLTRVQPARGPTIGGTRVDISSINSEMSYMRTVGLEPDLRCRVGYVGATVVYASNGRGHNQYGNNTYCIVPPLTGLLPAEVLVEVSLNGGADFIPSKAIFTYFKTPTVTAVLPTSAPVNGGSVLAVSGQDFPAEGDISCIFGSDAHAAQAIWVSASVLECVAPAHPPGFTLISAKFNGVDVATSTAILEYVEELSVSYISPEYSAASSGAIITIHGTGFINSSLLSMRWHLSPEVKQSRKVWHTIDLHFVNNSAATFQAPRVAMDIEEDNAVLVLEVSNNALDFTSVSTGVNLTIAGVPRVSECFPRYGSSLGGTRVSLVGRGFVPGVTWCRFGLRNFNDTTGVLVRQSLPLIVAEVSSYNNITCLTPEAIPSEYFIEVLTGSRSDDVYAANAEGSFLAPDVMATAGFTFIHAPRVTSAEPSVIPESGGVPVTIEGKNLTHTGIEACRFGGEDVVSAAWWSNSSVQCVSPSGNVGWVTIELTLNGADWMPVPVGVRYEPDRFVYSLYPTSGPLRGGTLLGVTGTGFVDSLEEKTHGVFLCSFGHIEVSFTCWCVIFLIARPIPLDGKGLASSLLLTTMSSRYLMKWQADYVEYEHASRAPTLRCVIPSR